MITKRSTKTCYLNNNYLYLFCLSTLVESKKAMRSPGESLRSFNSQTPERRRLRQEHDEQTKRELETLAALWVVTCHTCILMNIGGGFNYHVGLVDKKCGLVIFQNCFCSVFTLGKSTKIVICHRMLSVM